MRWVLLIAASNVLGLQRAQRERSAGRIAHLQVPLSRRLRDPDYIAELATHP